MRSFIAKTFALSLFLLVISWPAQSSAPLSPLVPVTVVGFQTNGEEILVEVNIETCGRRFHFAEYLPPEVVTMRAPHEGFLVNGLVNQELCEQGFATLPGSPFFTGVVTEMVALPPDLLGDWAEAKEVERRSWATRRRPYDR